jgi:hypothetical protein
MGVKNAMMETAVQDVAWAESLNSVQEPLRLKK